MISTQRLKHLIIGWLLRFGTDTRKAHRDCQSVSTNTGVYRILSIIPAALDSLPPCSCVSFDLILGADVVFRLDLVEPLLDVIYFFASPTTTIFISLELRCTFVFEKFQQAARQRFRVMPVNPKRFTSSTNCNVRIFKLKTLT
eukprot:GHVT01007172.1.p2 GENE.GHVT01007172.1~~GHVT01007172.1.p2  ORF type:complete len:143 (-),score=1.89 GHVT01007172.1:155-583(-)